MSEGGWYPPRKARVLDASVTSVKHESETTKRYARSGELSGGELLLPTPRDNGSPGPSSGRPAIVRVDPESGMPVEERRRPQVVPEPVASDDPAAPGGPAPGEPGEGELATPARLNRWQWLLTLCAEIDGFPRHLGIHVGGMLVTRTPLIDLVPIERATMPGRVVTQFDKEDIEALGLVKIDLLSLRTLGVVSDALDRIERDTGRRIDLDSLPHDDPEVYRSISSADTVGMFQVESRAQMQSLPKARPERFEDLVVQVAIIRPGPVQGNAVHPYLRRRAGEEAVTYAHPSLQPILEDTLGVILYQEQVMQVAIDVCGYSATEADIFRKAMGSHRSHAKMQAERGRFVGGAMRTGLTEADAEELFQKCSAFAEFGFARAHAAAFAKITYDTAWLKRYYPAHYTAGVLNNQPMGFYSPAVVVNDAKRHGIPVLPVDVNESAWEHDTRPVSSVSPRGASGEAETDAGSRLPMFPPRQRTAKFRAVIGRSFHPRQRTAKVEPLLVRYLHPAQRRPDTGDPPERGDLGHPPRAAPGEGDRRVGARDARARARHRSVHRRPRLRGPHPARRAGRRAAHQHRCLRLDRCAAPRAPLAAAHHPARRGSGASRARPDR